MNATEELAPTKPWHDLPLVDLGVRLPTRTREHLVSQGIDTLGKLAEALDDGRDIGLSDLAERCRVAIDDLRTDENGSDAPHIPEGAGGDGASTEPIGETVNRVIDKLHSANGVHALHNGEKVQAGQLPDQAEARAKIIEAAAECDECEKVFLVANERAKEAKKKFEGAKANLREVVRWSNTPIAPETPNLFSGVKDQPTTAPAKVLNDSSPASKAVEDCWRQFPLTRFDQFGLPASLIETLGSQGIGTVGELADYTHPNASGYAKRLSDLNGIGPGKVTKIEEATTAFWSMWPSKRDAFAQELGLLNGNACEPGDGSANPGDGGEGDAGAADAEAASATLAGGQAEAPEPKHAGGKRRRKAK